MHLVIALDGADPKLARMYFNRIKALGEIKDISTGNNTGESFGTILTGLPPSEHGLKGMEMGSDLDHIKGTLIWDKVKCKVGTANIPLAYPIKKINGWFVGGMMCPPNIIYTYPAELTDELNKLGYSIWIRDSPEMKSGWKNIFGYLFQSYFPHLLHNPLTALKKVTPHNIKVTLQYLKKEEYTTGGSPFKDNEWWDKEWRRITEIRTKGFLYLLNNYPVDLALMCYKCLDSIQHREMHMPERIKEWYEIQDREVEKLLNGLKQKPESITIFSDHGFEKKEHGYITGDHRPTGMFVSTKPNDVKNLIDAHNFILELVK